MDGMSATITLQAIFFFSSRRRHTRFDCDWSSDVCSSDLLMVDRVAFLLQLLRLDAETHHVVALLEAAHAFGEHADHPLNHLGELLHALRQIGRASCRERV